MKRRNPTCYWCGRAIKFNPAVLSPRGKLIPLELDGHKHNCPKSPYNTRRMRGELTMVSLYN